MFEQTPLLSLLIWLPIIGGVAVLLSRSADQARWLALGVSVAVFMLSLLLWTGFEGGTAAMQFVERVPWIKSFDIDYHLGVDGISMPLMILTTFTTVLVVIAGWDVIQYKPAASLPALMKGDGGISPPPS